MKQTMQQIPEELQRLPEELKGGLRKVDKNELLQLRLTGKRFFVIKIYESLYVIPYKRGTEPSKIEKIKYLSGKHHCGSCANFCNESTKRLCPKVADGSLDACKKYCHSPIDAVMEAKRMEKYPFIKMGVEQVNAADDFFVVAECANFKVAKNNQTEETHTDTDQKWEYRAQQVREDMEAQRKARQGEHWDKFGYKPW